MPRYLHIPHTPDTAQILTLSGRNCLVGDHGVGSWITGSVLVIIFQDRQSINGNTNEASNELS